MKQKTKPNYDAKQVIDHFGRKLISTTVDVSLQTVSDVYGRGIFPSAWYPMIRDLCRGANIECSDENFSFRKAN